MTTVLEGRRKQHISFGKMYTGFCSFFHEMTGVGLPVAWHSRDTRRPMATDRLRGTDTKVGGAVAHKTAKLCNLTLISAWTVGLKIEITCRHYTA